MPFYPGKPPKNSRKEAETLSNFYGYEPSQERQPTMSAAQNDYTPEQIEGMRRMVMEHDKSHQPNSFDLSKPPVEPYEYRKFPKMVYDHKRSEPCRDEIKRDRFGGEDQIHIPAKLVTKIVNNEAELKAALASGYQEKPPVFDAKEGESDELAEVAGKKR